MRIKNEIKKLLAEQGVHRGYNGWFRYIVCDGSHGQTPSGQESNQRGEIMGKTAQEALSTLIRNISKEIHLFGEIPEDERSREFRECSEWLQRAKRVFSQTQVDPLESRIDACINRINSNRKLVGD